MKGARAIAIAGAVLASGLAASADPWAIPAGQYFAGQQAPVSVYGAVPKQIGRQNRADRAVYVAIVDAAARREGIPVAFARRLVMRESGFNPRARSHQNAQGLMQIIPGTWRAERCSGSPWNAVDNAACGMRYLAKFYRQGGEHYAALRYHGGPNTRAHGPKTRAYAAALASPPAWAGRLHLAWVTP